MPCPTSLTATEIQAYATACHGSLEIDRIAHVVANETRRILRCDRVTVLVVTRGRLRVIAISGQSTVNRQSDVVTQLEHLAEVSRKYQGWPCVPPKTTELPPQSDLALQRYLDAAGPKQLICFPLSTVRQESIGEACSADQQLLGCLVVESFRGPMDAEESTSDCESCLELLAEHAVLALRNAITHRSVFLLPIWEAIGRWRTVAAARRRPAIAMIVVAIAALAATLIVPAPFRLAASGIAQPELRRNIFAGEDGVVHELAVRHGTKVADGALLITLRSTELDLRTEEIAGEIATAEKRLEAIRTLQVSDGSGTETTRTDQDRLAAEAEELRVKLEALRKQRELLARRRETLTLRSPIAGQVVTWDVEASLAARPVRRGQSLLTVADVDGKWNVELMLPERRHQHLVDAQHALGESLEVSMASRAEPRRVLRGKIVRVSSVVRNDELRGRYVPVIVEFVDSRPADWRPGAELEMRVECGRRTLAFVWFHEVVEFVYSTILF